MSRSLLSAASWAVGIVLAGALTPTIVFAAPVNTTANYVVSLGGINVATVAVDFKDQSGQYNVDIAAKVSGVGSLVTSGTAAAKSRGRSSANGLTAAGFDIETSSKSEQFNVAVQFTSGNATGFKVDPPLRDDIGRVALERKHLKNVSDPIGAFILKGNELGPDLCNRRLKVFTGIERYDVAMSFGATQTATSTRTGYQGPVALCKLRYLPISGHYTTSEMTDYLSKSDRILIWYAPLGDSGYFIPYRIIIGTSAGDLSVVLTNLG